MKQETTLEEVAERLLRQHPDFEVEGMSEYQNGRFNGIIEGIKWQQDKDKFSEEEVKEIVNHIMIQANETEFGSLRKFIDLQFEQFKKA
jgi:hypothetical protein